MHGLSIGAGTYWFKESYSIRPGRFKQTLLSGNVILHMTQYYPNKSHILIKTGIFSPDCNRAKSRLDAMLKVMHIAL